MTAKILVGVEKSDRSKDAVAFASRLARATGAELVLANAYPYDDFPGRAASPPVRAHLRQAAQEVLDRSRDEVSGVDDVRTCTFASVSPARALHILAERESADLVVIGSSHRGAFGRAFAGTTAERLLHGSPCPVAVVPRGFREQQDVPIATVAVAYDGSPECQSALAAATASARVFGACLKVIRVFEATMVGTPALVAGPGYYVQPGELQDRAREGLDAAVDAQPGDVPTHALLVDGDPVRQLTAESHTADLMFAGSRGYGPLRAVLAGSVSGRLVRHAACPVIVVPRGVASPLEHLFAVGSVGQAA
jgi:nucleotide-binding universal stress UspA family protein